MDLRKDIEEVLLRHLEIHHEHAVEELEPEEERLLSGLDLLPAPHGHLESGRRSVQAALLAGTDPGALYATMQAYDRAVGRIVAAEIDNVRLVLRDRDADERAEALDAYLHATMPLATDVFTILQSARLLDGLREALCESNIDEPSRPWRALALVDLVESTSHLANASEAETGEMVDVLFEAGHQCVRSRPVNLVKFVGDGFFLVGRDAREVADSALEALDAIAGRSPLAARAGLAAGFVVRRAGDYFGLPVGMAQRLTAVAPAWTVLAQRSSLPPDTEGERETHSLRGIEGDIEALVLRRN